METNIDIDDVVAKIYELQSIHEIAQVIGCTPGQLMAWISSDPIRQAQVFEARANAALFWDEKAEWALMQATDQLTLAKAKELAAHYRWRATKIAPRIYGDKQQVDVTATEKVYVIEGATEVKDIPNWKNEVKAFLEGGANHAGSG